MSKDVSKLAKGFDWSRVSWKDKEYLSTMYKEAINARSYQATGIPFTTMYPEAEDFAIFNDPAAKDLYKEKFYHSAEQATHLLFPHPRGRKYWLVWSYVKD